MTAPRLPLASKLFGAIGLTALAMVVVMALLVAGSMRDGFAKYLLREELTLLEPVAEVLGRRHDADRPGWPEFRANPYAWRGFVREVGPQPPDMRAPQPPDQPGPQPPDPNAPHAPHAPPVPVDTRLILLDATGRLIVGDRIEGAALETLAITAPGADDSAAPLGWLGLASHGAIQSETDAFFLRGQFLSLLYAGLLALALSGLGALLLARGFLVPIRALERGAERLAGGDYAARIPNGRSDELGRLIDHYNELARSLEQAEQAQRRWVSDTSHELQTPLAVLRANIEAVQDGVRPADTHTLAAMEDAVSRLTRLVQDLRLLSAWREDGLVAEMREADLGAIADAALDAAAESFAAAGLTLEADVAAPLPVCCDPQRMRQVIDNLLANTLRYTDAPGKARLCAWQDAAGFHLTLDDTAPAPPEASMPLLFDRFHRGEASRSRAHGGSGLGLAICKAIVDAHGGTIAAECAPMGGLTIHVTLPAGDLA